jgi:dihydroorotate dehydrogenase (fumarate)
VWIEFAKLIEQTAWTLWKLNLFSVPADLNQDGAEIETNYLRIVAAVKATVQMPIAVKLSPFLTSFSNVARKLVQQGGANALVLFNRFYQPDFNRETFETVLNALLSTSVENAFTAALDSDAVLENLSRSCGHVWRALCH